MSLFKFNEKCPLDFIALGRLCIDLNANETNRPMEETITFTKYVGGSPANISIGLSRLGFNCGFIGKVSNDQMGRFILQYLEKNNIDVSQVQVDKTNSVTGLAFTEIKSPTECSILMYRDNVADLNLEPKEVSEEYIRNAKALLISGTALAKSPSREAVFLALEYANKHGVATFFDLDYRPYTWSSPEETAIYYSLAAEKCDAIFGTREEFDLMEYFWVENKNDLSTASHWLAKQAKLVIIKHGKNGSTTYTNDGRSYQGTVFPARIVKTFGAGDSYASAYIYGLMQGWEIEKCMEYASASASIVISSHSCSDAMPSLDQISRYIEKCKSGEINA